MDERVEHITYWYPISEVMNWLSEDYGARKVSDILDIETHSSDDHFDDLVKDIAENGFMVPVLIGIDALNNICIINGNHRILAAIKLGMEKIPAADYMSFHKSCSDGNTWGDGNDTRWHKMNVKEKINA